jgi:hypothetical protein
MKPLLLTALLAAALPAYADPVSSHRYIDAQGVEIIRGRNATTPASSMVSGGLVDLEAKPHATLARSAVGDPKLKIAPAEQAERDRDRIAILEQELQEESRAFVALSERAAGKQGHVKRTPDELASAQGQLVQHQKNIEALNAELRLARLSR